jgi:flagellin
MNISSLSGLASLQQQQNIQKASSKLSSAIVALVSSKVSGASGDVASLSVAGQLQAAVSGLKQASGNLAQASSLAQVADGGLSQIQNVAEQIQTLAQQASSPALNDENRKTIDAQFKELMKQIDKTVASTSFNGKKLLNGDLSGAGKISLESLLNYGANSNEYAGLSIANLASDNLFGSGELNLATAAGASNVEAVVAGALSSITSTRANVGSFLKTMDYAAASVDSAVFNQDAARSSLQESDFADAASSQSQATLQNNAALAIAAQGNRLPSALLQLVG